jgi:hypothetical protein
MSVNSAKIVFFASTDDDRESDLADDGDVGSGLERPTGLVLLPLAGCLGSRHILVELVPPVLPRQRWLLIAFFDKITPTGDDMNVSTLLNCSCRKKRRVKSSIKLCTRKPRLSLYSIPSCALMQRKVNLEQCVKMQSHEKTIVTQFGPKMIGHGNGQSSFVIRALMMYDRDNRPWQHQAEGISTKLAGIPT